MTERARVEISVETRVWDRDVRLLNMRNRERANKGETHQELEEVVTADEGEVWRKSTRRSSPFVPVRARSWSGGGKGKTRRARTKSTPIVEM